MMSVFCDNAPLSIKIEYAFRIYGKIQSAYLKQNALCSIIIIHFFGVDQNELKQDCFIKKKNPLKVDNFLNFDNE